jgi:hypothetical protein
VVKKFVQPAKRRAARRRQPGLFLRFPPLHFDAGNRVDDFIGRWYINFGCRCHGMRSGLLIRDQDDAPRGKGALCASVQTVQVSCCIFRVVL